MSRAVFQFHAELNDFLPRRRQGVAFDYGFERRASIKDMIEALGVPHPEVECIVVNGAPVDWTYQVRDGDRIAVHPPSSAPDELCTVRVGPGQPAERRFILDTHLGKLADYLRLLGFDTLYRNDYDDAELALASAEEQRILLTRDIHLLKRGIVRYGYFVRATDPRWQIVEIVRRYHLVAQVAPYRRCIRCNGLLRPVEKAAIQDRLAPKTRQYFEEFHLCDGCGQIFWKGSHYGPTRQLIEDVLRQASSA